MIVCQWDRNPAILGMFTVFWLGFVGFTLFWFHGMLGNEPFFDWLRQSDWMAKIMLSSPVLIAVGGGYGLLATFLNHTEILVTECDLRIRVRPIPCTGNRTVSKSAIVQLFVREKSSRDSYGKISKSYEVHWIDSKNQRQPLIGRLRNHEALYLEKRLEELLGIDDQFVSGGFRG